MTKTQAVPQEDAWIESDEIRQNRKEYQARIERLEKERAEIGGDKGAEEIVDRINAYIAAGVRVPRIVAECESGPTRSQLEVILSEKRLDPEGYGIWWDSDAARMHLIALKQWADEEDAAGQGQEDHAETAIYKRVYGICRMAHKSRALFAITGMYGIGKTFAARCYAFDYPRRPNEAGTVYFEFPPGTKGDVGVLDAILEALEPHGQAKGNVNAKLGRILGLLRPGDFIIADECGIPADHGTGLRFMSYINEQAGIPVLMIGNPAFHGGVWGKRTDYDALASRTRHIALDANGAEDVEAFMVWRQLNGKRWRDALLTVARLPGRDGGLRAVVELLDEMGSRGVDLAPESFLSIAKAYGRGAA